jgi:hypothetical protein
MISYWFSRLPPAAQYAFVGSCLALSMVPGCERKERVLDIDTPGVDVEVDRDVDTGEVEVDVNDK